MEKATLERIMKKALEIEKNPALMLCENMRGKMLGCKAITSSCAHNATCKVRIETALKEISEHSATANYWLQRFLLPSTEKEHITQKRLIKELEKIGFNNIPICAFCYAHRALTVGSGENMDIKYAAVGKVLSEKLLSENELPIVPGFYGAAVSEKNPDQGFSDNRPHERIESFGDTANDIQARNYIRLVKNNPRVMFSAWTKNPEHWYRAILAENGKPENLKLILSSYRMNKPDIDIAVKYNSLYPGMIDTVFTVWTENSALHNGIILNCCGSERDKIIPRQCSTCMNCYLKNGNPETVQHFAKYPEIQAVNEILR